MADLTVIDSFTERADSFAQILSTIASDDAGIVRTCIHRDGPRPVREDDLPASMTKLGVNCTRTGFACYEDAGMTTGAFLALQCHRYQVTGEPAAMTLAQQAFDGIRTIYALGAARKPGYYPKPYDGKVSDHISRDQYLYTMNGLAAYHAIASRPIQAEIEEMVGTMARYWIDADYQAGYFTLPSASHLTDFMGSLYLGIIGIAAKLTGDRTFQQEYDRLYYQENLGERMPETLRAQFRRGQLYDGATYFRQQENPMAMKGMAIDYLWESDPAHRDAWSDSLQRFWDDDVLVALNRESGLNYYIVGYNAATDRTYLTEPGVIPELENPLELPGLTWGGLRQAAGSTQTAFAATIIGSRLGNAEATRTAQEILGKLELDSFRGWTVPSAEHVPPGDTWHTEVYQSCYLAYWLWAYWLGRNRG